MAMAMAMEVAGGVSRKNANARTDLVYHVVVVKIIWKVKKREINKERGKETEIS